ncbi:MAG: PAS domain S-box protein [Oligoflexia bacterium]|nr:PAS domain S-box protein [Oligoflexia bacterium]
MAENTKKFLGTELKMIDLLDALPQGIGFCDLDEVVLHVNAKLCEMTGFGVEELVGRQVSSTLLAPEHDAFLREQTARRCDGHSDDYELPLLRKDGSTFWASISAAPMKDSSGAVIGTLAAVIDVTDRKAAEAALVKQREFLRDVIDTMPNWVFTRDSSGRYTLANKSFVDFCRVSREELLGKTPYEFMQHRDASRYLREDQEVLQSLKPLEVTEERVSVPRSQESLWVNVIKKPLLSPEHGAPQVLSVITDITEIKRAEEALHTTVEGTAGTTAEDFFRSAAFHLAKALGTKYAFLGRVSERDPALVDTLAVWWEDHFLDNFSFKLAGTPSEQVLGSSMTHIPADLQKLFPSDHYLAQSGAEGYLGLPIYSASGNASGVIAVWNDKPLSDWGPARSILRIFAARAGAELERLKAEQDGIKLQRQLLQAQKMEAIGQLAAGVAHDLNNALGAVVGHLQLLQLHKPSQKELERSVAVALDGCEKASSLVEQLLGFARQGKYNLGNLCVQDSVRRIIQFIGRIIDGKTTIEEQSSDENFYVRADEAQLQQVLINLLLNAQKAMPQGGRIKISFGVKNVANADKLNRRAVPGDFVTISVRDSGIGIPSENLDKIFEPFFTTRTDGGNGLGLPMVYGIMQNHGGWIEVESAPGRGSTFTLYFPRLASGELTMSTQSDVSISTGAGLVMVLDDEAPLVELTRIFLEKAGFQVQGFTSPFEALKWYEHNYALVDLIILDMKMPNMDGTAAFDELRRIDPAAQVIVLSGYIQDSAVHNLLERGVIKFFQKPLQYPMLTKWVVERSNSGKRATKERPKKAANA